MIKPKIKISYKDHEPENGRLGGYHFLVTMPHGDILMNWPSNPALSHAEAFDRAINMISVNYTTGRTIGDTSFEGRLPWIN